MSFNESEYKKLVWRGSIAAMSLIGLFWAAWYVVNGSVPSANTIRITEGIEIFDDLLTVSRFWDVLLGVGFAVAFAHIATTVAQRFRDCNVSMAWFAGVCIFAVALGIVYGDIGVMLPIFVTGFVFALCLGVIYSAVSLSVGHLAILAIAGSYALGVGLGGGVVLVSATVSAFGIVYWFAIALKSGWFLVK